MAGRVGAIVESPQFFGNFTGVPHAAAARPGRRACRAAGSTRCWSWSACATGRDERVKSYSLGMKQRLAVASALLKDPELLILDEPANGLDPAGIREMRDLMRSLAAAGVTVLVSSHILAEIQLICDHVTIISPGPPGGGRAGGRGAGRLRPARVPGAGGRAGARRRSCCGRPG